MDIQGERVYTPGEVAQVLRVAETTIRREIRKGQLGALQVGRHYRITHKDLISWLGQERYLAIFTPNETLSLLIGAGGLEEDEAAAEAEKLVRRARREATRRVEGAAPSPEEVRKRRSRSTFRST